MKKYTVEPGKQAATWMIKLEGVAPAKTYDVYDEAVEEGKTMAENNKPSKLVILNQDKEIKEELTFEE